MTEPVTPKHSLGGACFPWGATVPLQYRSYFLVEDAEMKNWRGYPNSFIGGPLLAPRFPALFADTKEHLMELVDKVQMEDKSRSIAEWNVLFAEKCQWMKY